MKKMTIKAPPDNFAKKPKNSKIFLYPSVGKPSAARTSKNLVFVGFAGFCNRYWGFLKNDITSMITLHKPAISLGSEIWLGKRKFQMESVSCR